MYNSVFDGKMGCQRTYFSIIYVEALVYLSYFSTTKSRFQLAKRQLLTIFLLQWSLAQYYKSKGWHYDVIIAKGAMTFFSPVQATGPTGPHSFFTIYRAVLVLANEISHNTTRGLTDRKFWRCPFDCLKSWISNWSCIIVRSFHALGPY